MRLLFRVLLAGAAFAASAAAAEFDPAPVMKLRAERMKNDLGGATKRIAGQLKEAAPDRGAIAAAAATIRTNAHEMPAWFPAGSGPETGWGLAKSEIWERPEAFKMALQKFARAADRLAEEAAAGAAIEAPFTAVTEACSACHTDFRIPKD
jgi:cytochrome c556